MSFLAGMAGALDGASKGYNDIWERDEKVAKEARDQTIWDLRQKRLQQIGREDMLYKQDIAEESADTKLARDKELYKYQSEIDKQNGTGKRGGTISSDVQLLQTIRQGIAEQKGIAPEKVEWSEIEANWRKLKYAGNAPSREKMIIDLMTEKYMDESEATQIVDGILNPGKSSTDPGGMPPPTPGGKPWETQPWNR
jgi:hypothetical protein